MKLLLAEDTRALARATQAYLQHAGYDVDVVGDGEGALDALRSGEYDGVLLDIMMPKMSGMEVLSAIRADGNDVPVMMLTALDTLDERVEGLEGGADDYLTKPFEMREMVARVRAMTRTRRVEPTDDMRMGDVTLRRSTSEMTNGYGTFRISDTEMRMAEMLTSSNGAVVTTQRLCEKLGGDELAVRLYASYLASKMESLHSAMTVVAGDGGYRLGERG